MRQRLFLCSCQAGDFFQHVLVDFDFSFQLLAAARMAVGGFRHVVEEVQDHGVQVLIDDDVERVGLAVHGQGVLFEEAHAVVGIEGQVRFFIGQEGRRQVHGRQGDALAFIQSPGDGLQVVDPFGWRQRVLHVGQVDVARFQIAHERRCRHDDRYAGLGDDFFPGNAQAFDIAGPFVWRFGDELVEDFLGQEVFDAVGQEEAEPRCFIERRAVTVIVVPGTLDVGQQFRCMVDAEALIDVVDDGRVIHIRTHHHAAMALE